MNRMQKHNLYHIKRTFEKKTGIGLIPASSKEQTEFEENIATRKRLPRVALIAAIVTVFVTLTAFAVTIFSTWAGDSLTITASYYGDGIVWVEITNQSDKDLKLEPKMKLYYYSTQKLVESTAEEPYIENLTIPANSTEKVRLDLRRTYDVEALENSKNDFYYLQMTNDSFLLGQKWSCMVSFVLSDYVTPWYELSDERCLEGALPSLKSYYKNFTWDVFARWPDAFDYMELVQAELAKVDGNVVRTSMEGYLEWDGYDWMRGGTTSVFDPYNKLMGIDDTEHFRAIGVTVPCMLDDGSFNGQWSIDLFFPYCYAKADIQSPQDYAFVRGHLLTFEEMEQYKVYEDDKNVVYEMHEFFYTDLHTYVQDMLLQRDDIYFTEDTWKRIENFYNHFRDKEKLAAEFEYLPQNIQPLSIDDLVDLAALGTELTAEDFESYLGGFTDAYGDYGPGYYKIIDDDYEFVNSKNMDGTLKGFFLIHTPTGDMLQLGLENVDVAAFVEEHGEPEPRCECENTDGRSGHHGWRITIDWIIEKGKDIDISDSHGACRLYVGDNNEDRYYERIVVDDNFFLIYEAIPDGPGYDFFLVHTATMDECNLKTDDLQAFLATHQN